MGTNVKALEVIEGTNKNDLLEEVKQNRAINKNKYQLVTYLNESWYQVTNKGRTFLSLPYAEYFLSKYKLVTCEEDIYFYQNGCYKNVTKEFVKNIMIKDFGIDYKSNWQNEALDMIKNLSYMNYDKFSKTFNKRGDIINIKNGLIVFDFLTGEYSFKNHTPQLKSTIQINAEYDDNKRDHPFWDKFLNTSLNTNKERMFLQEITGYYLINHLADGQGQSIFVFDGEGGNGKGTYDRLLTSILGHENIYKAKANHVTDSDKQNQFFGFQLINKLALIISETNYDLKDLSFLKELSGGDMQFFEVKGSMQTIGFTFEGKVKLSTNKKTKIYDTSKGVRRRLKFLKMDNEIKEVISRLDDKLENEKNAIFIWALEGLKRLIKNNWCFTLPDSHFDLMDRYMEHSNNYLKFINKHIVVGNGGIIKADLFTLMNQEFGNMYKIKDDLYENIEKTLKDEGIEFSIKKARYTSIIDDSSKVTYGYAGINYVEHKDDQEHINTSDELYTSNINYIKEYNSMNEKQLRNNAELILKALAAKEETGLINFYNDSKQLLKKFSINDTEYHDLLTQLALNNDNLFKEKFENMINSDDEKEKINTLLVLIDQKVKNSNAGTFEQSNS